jgi:iron complex outermembrane receptor protein
MKDLRSRKYLSALSLLAAAGFIATPGFGQTSTLSTTPDSTQTLDKFVVTGSYLPLSADAPAVPVTVIDSASIAASGETTNLQEVLLKVAPQFSGNLNLGPTNGNIAENSTNGASQIALRNLPTLVLINGHRAAFAPVDSVGGYQFVDLNLIPVSAVEKIEIVTDGASAIYGSDAVGGVVNVILKSNYSGFEVGGRYGFSTGLVTGHYQQKTVYLTGGVSNGTTSITLSAEWVKTDPLYQYQVTTSRYTTGTATYAGVINIGTNYYILNPKYNSPPNNGTHTPIATLVANGVYSGPYTSGYIINNFNLAQKPTSEIGDQRKALVLDFDHKISDKLKFSGDVLYSQTDTFSQLNAQPVSVTSTIADPNNPTDATVTARNRIVGNPRQYITDSSSLQGLASFDGKLNEDYSWTATADYNNQRQHFQNPNLVSASQLAAAKAANTLDLFNYNQSATALASAAIFGTAFGEYQTNLLTYDALFRGKPFTLPGGDFQFAVGAEYRREGLSSNADVNSLPNSFNWASGTTITPLTTSRGIWAEFAQVDVPITGASMHIPFAYTLGVDVAVRHEAYDRVAKKPTDPLIALRYQPFDDQFTVRGSYTQSFIAPTLFQLYGPGGIGFSSSLAPFQTAAGPTIANAGQANTQTGANAQLRPSTAESYTFGFVYSPKSIKGFSITTDYFRIRQTSIVGTANSLTALQDVELRGAASPYAQYTSTGNFIGQAGAKPITAPGQVYPNLNVASATSSSNVFFLNNNANIGGIKYEGMDLALAYTWDVAGVGRFEAGSKNTYNFAYWVNTPGQASEETAGKVSAYNGTLPRWRAYTWVSYSRGGWNAYFANTFIHSLTDDNDGEHVNGYYSWDTSIGYTFSSSDYGLLSYLKGLKLSIGVNDLFNRQPSNDYSVFAQDNADISTYSPTGRFVYIEARYKF